MALAERSEYTTGWESRQDDPGGLLENLCVCQSLVRYRLWGNHKQGGLYWTDSIDIPSGLQSKAPRNSSKVVGQDQPRLFPSQPGPPSPLTQQLTVDYFLFLHFLFSSLCLQTLAPPAVGFVPVSVPSASRCPRNASHRNIPLGFPPPPLPSFFNLCVSAPLREPLPLFAAALKENSRSHRTAHHGAVSVPPSSDTSDNSCSKPFSFSSNLRLPVHGPPPCSPCPLWCNKG